MARKRRVPITDNRPAQCTTRKSQTTQKNTIIKARQKQYDCQTSMKAQNYVLSLSHTHARAYVRTHTHTRTHIPTHKLSATAQYRSLRMDNSHSKKTFRITNTIIIYLNIFTQSEVFLGTSSSPYV